MPLWDHFREFRRRVLFAVVAVLAGAIVGYLLFERYFDVLLEPYCRLTAPADCQVNAFRATDPISTRLRAATVFGLFAAGPIIFFQAWRFVAPGLTQRERRLALPFVVSSQVMFALGLGFAYWFVPSALEVLLALGGPTIVPLLGAREYLSFILSMGLAFGVAFEVPLLLVFLAALGVVSSAGLRRARRFAIVGNLILASIVTPTDLLSLFAVGIPLIVLYEVAIGAAWLIERRRTQA